LVPLLLAKDAAVRVVTRDAAKVARLDPRVERVNGDLRERETVKRAVAGASRVFLVGFIADPSHTADRMLIEESAAAGVEHIVKISAIGTGGGGIAASHREQERLVEQSGMAWTFLRCGMFMSNALQWAPMVKAQGKVYSPMGHGKVAPISPRDIAAVAAEALTGAGHAGKSYDLTGGEVLSVPEQVRILAEVLGRPLEFVDLPPEAAADGMRKSGIPDFLVDGLVELYKAVRAGNAATSSDDFRRVIGRPPQTFQSWCVDHKAAFV
jgi:uncharacterized protein YbjT (DUF2867 family)